MDYHAGELHAGGYRSFFAEVSESLVLYARHLGWLRATPDKAEKPRGDTYTEGSPYLELPPLTAYEQSLVKHWYSCGTATQTSAGAVPLVWGEIIAWAKHLHKTIEVKVVEHPKKSSRHKSTYSTVVLEGCSLTDWELEQIRLLSECYTSEVHAARDPQRECPKPIFLDEVSAEDATKNADAMADAFKTLFGADNTPAVEMVRNE